MADDASLLQFPCDLPIKVFGENSPQFRATVIAVVESHFGRIAERDVVARASSGGRYLSLTITVRTESKAQADAVFGDLTANPDVLMVL
jgi:uncharacterized protein